MINSNYYDNQIGLSKDPPMSLKEIFKEYTPAPEAAEIDYTAPYEMGSKGQKEKFRAAMFAANQDCKAKRQVYLKINNRAYTNPTVKCSKEYQRAEAEFNAAFKTLSDIQDEFYKGACNSFYFQRPEGIQFIFSSLPEFCRGERHKLKETLAADMLVELMEQSLTRDEVPALALKDLSRGEARDILNSALSKLVNEHKGSAASIPALLKAGADASLLKDTAGIILVPAKKAARKKVLLLSN
jgi:hypothetical protein